jgi:eukaryotic-like serine/threonine-protein kinase
MPGTPSSLGPYRLCRVLGAGGMATVYLGYDQRLAGVHRLVALKCIHPHLADSREIVEMFLDEATIASAISHPNVCRVSDYGAHDGVRFLAMEYLCGEALGNVQAILAKARADGKLSWQRWLGLCLRILGDACEGLHALHELRRPSGEPWQAVHRDVSPDNLVVTCAGAVKLVDFGIVKACGQRHRTEAGMIKGKLSYLAPETLRGAEPDRRADVWSLGVIAWELLSGSRLFRRPRDTEAIAAITRDPIERLSGRIAGLPDDLDAVLASALERDPERRLPTARAFGRALAEVARAHGAEASPGELQEWVCAAFGHDSACGQRVLESLGDEATLIPVDLDDAERTPATASVPSVRPRRRWSRRWLVGGAVASVLLVVGISQHPAPELNSNLVDTAQAAAAGIGANGEPELSIEIRRGGRVLWRAPIDPDDERQSCTRP